MDRRACRSLCPPWVASRRRGLHRLACVDRTGGWTCPASQKTVPPKKTNDVRLSRVSVTVSIGNAQRAAYGEERALRPWRQYLLGAMP